MRQHQSDNVIHIGRHPVSIPPPLMKGDPHPAELTIPMKYDWVGFFQAVGLGVLGAIMALVVTLLVAGCGGSQQVAQGAEKVAIQKSAESCDDRAVAIIKTGETCEAIVNGLNKLVADDPTCQRVFRTKDPVATCAQMGIQPRAKAVAK